jgi:hypothetical protein
VESDISTTISLGLATGYRQASRRKISCDHTGTRRDGRGGEQRVDNSCRSFRCLAGNRKWIIDAIEIDCCLKSPIALFLISVDSYNLVPDRIIFDIGIESNERSNVP